MSAGHVLPGNVSQVGDLEPPSSQDPRIAQLDSPLGKQAAVGGPVVHDGEGARSDDPPRPAPESTDHSHGTCHSETPHGCKHYRRNCLIKAKCCNKYFGCRLCHDEEMDHSIDRKATEFVTCLHCGVKDMPVGAFCENCGIRFARYYCEICKFYDDSEGKEIYHCDDCGICRLGRREEQFHCKRCDSCVPLSVKDSHPCLVDSLKRNCPVCQEYLASSTEQVLYMRCGHAIHASCFTEYTRTSYTCPLCWKSLTDMSSWYAALDASLAQEMPLPGEYGRRRSIVYCNDCEVNSETAFHFKYHKCMECGGYNTRLVSVISGDCKPSDADPQDRGSQGGIQAVETDKRTCQNDCCGEHDMAAPEVKGDKLDPSVIQTPCCASTAMEIDRDAEAEAEHGCGESVIRESEDLQAHGCREPVMRESEDEGRVMT